MPMCLKTFIGQQVPKGCLFGVHLAGMHLDLRIILNNPARHKPVVECEFILRDVNDNYIIAGGRGLS